MSLESLKEKIQFMHARSKVIPLTSWDEDMLEIVDLICKVQSQGKV